NILSRDESYSRSREAALHALQLDGDLPLARVALAQIKFYYEWDWEHAEEEFRRAVDLNPSDPDAHGQYGWFLAARGRVVEALDEMKRARELDPLSPTRRPPVAAVLIYARRFDEATRELQAALRLNPNYAVVHSGLARAYAAQRMFREAIEELPWPAFAGAVAVQL